tara:strand:- start:183 stop:875 length:693 start_codon:yes stop_codon:yes gene_type:complete
MSILSEQLIGGTQDTTSWSEKPFGDAQKNEETFVGFGGYSYAQNREMQEAFNTTPSETRTGPVNDTKLTSYEEQYGAKGRRLPNSSTTILGQMGVMLIVPEAGSEDPIPTWSTKGGGKKMAHLFTSSRSLRSLRDSTGTMRVTSGGQKTWVPNSSGGAFEGYDTNNHYGISNWMAEGGAGNAAVEGVAAQEGNQYQEAVEGVEGVEASNKEIFSPSVTVQTGMRNMPPMA